MKKIKTALDEKREALAAKKRIRTQKRRLDFQSKLRNKIGEVFDGITINPVKGVILAPKKKRQLVAELRRLERRLLQSGKKKRKRP